MWTFKLKRELTCLTPPKTFKEGFSLHQSCKYCPLLLWTGAYPCIQLSAVSPFWHLPRCRRQCMNTHCSCWCFTQYLYRVHCKGWNVNVALLPSPLISLHLANSCYFVKVMFFTTVCENLRLTLPKDDTFQSSAIPSLCPRFVCYGSTRLLLLPHRSYVCKLSILCCSLLRSSTYLLLPFFLPKIITNQLTQTHSNWSYSTLYKLVNRSRL